MIQPLVFPASTHALHHSKQVSLKSNVSAVRTPHISSAAASSICQARRMQRHPPKRSKRDQSTVPRCSRGDHRVTPHGLCFHVATVWSCLINAFDVSWWLCSHSHVSIWLEFLFEFCWFAKKRSLCCTNITPNRSAQRRSSTNAHSLGPHQIGDKGGASKTPTNQTGLIAVGALGNEDLSP